MRPTSSWLKTTILTALFGIAMVSPGPSAAGPVADFERVVRSAYADFRSALFHTNTKNAEASLTSIAAFEVKWSALASLYRAAPPPQYADDPRFGETLDFVARSIAEAKTAVASGDLGKSHDTLEAVRDALGDLRLRNGLLGFSDRVNAFHEHMEHALARANAATPEGLAELREDAAVLGYIAEELKKHPSPDAANADYAPLLDALIKAVADLRSAARAGNTESAKAAIGRLKPAFARFFVKFG